MYNESLDIDKLKFIKSQLYKNQRGAHGINVYNIRLNLLNQIIRHKKDPLKFIDDLRTNLRSGIRNGPLTHGDIELREELRYLNELFPENYIDIENEIISQKHGEIPNQVIYLRKKKSKSNKLKRKVCKCKK